MKNKQYFKIKNRISMDKFISEDIRVNINIEMVIDTRGGCPSFCPHPLWVNST